VGASEGDILGASEGESEGATEGRLEGEKEGERVGTTKLVVKTITRYASDKKR
jgi:predicted transposase YdaD